MGCRILSLRGLDLSFLVMAVALAGVLSGCEGTEPGGGGTDAAGTDAAGTDTAGTDTAGTDAAADAHRADLSVPVVEASFESAIQSTTDNPATDVTIEQAIPGDLNGDGFLDLVGLSASGQIVVKLLDPSVSTYAPFSYLAAQVIETGFGATQIQVGDFDASGTLDVVALDPAAGALVVALNKGDGTLGDPTRFDDEALAFGDGANAFVAGGMRWLVADFDGNGTDDMVLAGASGLRLGLFGRSRVAGVDGVEGAFADLSGAPGLADPALGFDDPIIGFDDPIVGIKAAEAFELDGTPGAELIVALDNGKGAFSAVSFFDFDLPVSFDDPIIGFDDPIIGFDDPIIGLGTTSIPSGARDVAVADVDVDGIDDFAVLASAGGLTSIAVWTSAMTFTGTTVAFDDPIIGFDDPIIGFDAAIFAFEGDFGSLEPARIVSVVGGNATADPTAEMPPQLLALSNGTTTAVVDFSAGNVGVGFVETCTFLEGMTVADFNGDGFAEFLGTEAGSFKVTSQLGETLATGDPGVTLPEPEPTVCTLQ